MTSCACKRSFRFRSVLIESCGVRAAACSYHRERRGALATLAFAVEQNAHGSPSVPPAKAPSPRPAKSLQSLAVAKAVIAEDDGVHLWHDGIPAAHHALANPIPSGLVQDSAIPPSAIENPSEATEAATITSPDTG